MPDGGGGDGGSARREQAEQGRRASAIDQINAYFGVNPTTPKIVTPAKPAVAGSPGGTSEHGGWQAPIAASPAVAAVTAPNPLMPVAAGNRAARDALYASTRGDVLDLNLQKLQEFATEADRQRRFDIARKGQSGSSVDVDSQAAFRRKYNEGALNASGQADQSALDFRTSDEASRLNLINQINAGGDVNTGVQSAVNSLRLNADAARTGARDRLINNSFGDLATTYAYGADLAGRDAAAARYGLLRRSTPGPKNYSGTVTGS